MANLLERIHACESEEQLDDLRDEIIQVGKVFGYERFHPLQRAFIDKQAQLRGKTGESSKGGFQRE